MNGVRPSSENKLFKTTENLRDEEGMTRGDRVPNNSLPCEETPLVASAIASTLAAVLVAAIFLVVPVRGGVVTVIPVGGGVVAVGDVVATVSVVPVGVATITANSNLDAR